MPLAPDLLGVLIVDDDAAFARTTADVLRLRGFEPYTAQTGRRAIEIAALRPPAVALVDLGLPDMDGIDLLAELHAAHASTEVVVVTGNASIASAVRAVRQRIFDYLLKPASPEQLVATLERAGERWRRRRAEAALAATEERFRSLIENATDPIAIIGASGSIQYASPAYQRALGRL
jgi:DNA-binding NtrC family response regulator